MYKEILKEDIARVLDKMKEEAVFRIASGIGEENAEKLSSDIVILPDVYGFLPLSEFLLTLGWNEYAVFTYEGKTYIASHSYRGVKEALDSLELSAKHENGVMPVFDEPCRCRVSSFPTDIPNYRGGRYVGAFDHADGNYGFIVEGTADCEFDSYIALTENRGYIPEKETESGGNRCILLKNGENRMIYAYYSRASRCASVIGGDCTYTDISVTGDGNVCKPILWQGHPSASNGGMGMSYFLRLSDGSFFVIDGGFNNNGEEDDLFESLERLNVRPDGIVIRVWLITHGHDDHYNTLRGFAANKADKVTVERIVFSETQGDYLKNSDTVWHWDIRAFADNFAGCRFVKPFAGQRWLLPGCTVDVLFSAQDAFNNPFYIKSLNNASTVIRITVCGQTILFPADIEADSADIICGRFGNDLRCDILQIAHHGYHGASDEFYTLCQPKLVLYPVMEGYDKRFDNMAHGNYVWRRLPSVKKVVPSYTGSTSFVLPYDTDKEN